jgi:hypothetical protein
VDIIAALDGYLFVLEVKSTFIRRSQRDAWVHAATTQRKAGQQLARKTVAVLGALKSDAAMCADLGLAQSPIPEHCHAWIVDTSIENDHQRFNGFLKVSLEELMIALRDDAHLLSDEAIRTFIPEEARHWRAKGPSNGRVDSFTLYPNGFGAQALIEVIESARVWLPVSLDPSSVS